MAVYQVAPTWNVVFLPFFVLLALVTALGVSLWLSALYVLYRDVQYVIPFLVQLWFFLTPVFYPTSEIPTGWPSVDLQPEPHDGGHRRLSLGAPRPAGPGHDVLALGRDEPGRLRGRPATTSGAWSASSRTSYEHRDQHLRARQAVHDRRRTGARGDPARRDHERRHRARPPAAPRGLVDRARERALGAARRELRRGRRSGDRRHRPQRRRQEHPAQDPHAHHRADDGAHRASTGASAACSKWAPGSTRSSAAARTSTSTAPSWA